MAGAAAFFDVDGTLIRRASALALAPALRRRGILRRRDLLRAARFELAARARGLTEEHLHETTRNAAGLLRGHPHGLMGEVTAEELERTLLPLAYDGAVDRVREHARRGEPTFAVTGGLDEIAEPLARALGLDGTIGTRVGVAGGRYTGAVDLSCHGEVKAEAVRQLARERDLDLARSSAYTDSASDLALLELVGHPHAVNPDRTLRRVAQARGWTVLSFA